ncbi:Rid family hydrolase [Cupriavidus sp. CV2]|uniref:Rid family hydrolase n=1 Tax=Cupriavidus ulmosensis TaxID=3065913 RepID=UPI00296B26CD|nr:Rid family hydrolase [Cupriavidus sp. CV2]MDW3684497.1 Rid family hydrolase [Cupriavidus sp. CV2]
MSFRSSRRPSSARTATIRFRSGHPPGDFDGQARAAFQCIQKTLDAAGGKLSDIVSMTVFITGVRSGEHFADSRKKFFAPGKYPAGALIAIRNLGVLVRSSRFG